MMPPRPSLPEKLEQGSLNSCPEMLSKNFRIIIDPGPVAIPGRRGVSSSKFSQGGIPYHRLNKHIAGLRKNLPIFLGQM